MGGDYSRPFGEEEMEERILAIDDEIEVAELLVRRLGREGYSCETAVSGEGALSKVEEKRFALALIDIRMPGMDGIQLLRRMKELDPDMAAVMVTAIKDRESAVRSMKLGANDYIVKPFDLDEVVASVRRALEKRRLVLQVKEYQRDLESKVEEKTEELRRRNRELAALNAVATAMMQSAVYLEDVLQRITDGVVEGLGCNTALILLLDEKEGFFRGKAVSTRGKTIERINSIIGFPVVQIEVPARRDFNEAVSNAWDGRMTIKHDLYELAGPLLSRPVCSVLQGLLGSQTFLSVPLSAREKVVGGIFASTRREKISERDEETMMAFANQAAIAIENAKLYKAEQEGRRIAETLRQASTVLSSTLELDEVLRLILQQLRQAITCDSASVQRLQDKHLKIVACQGFEEPDKVVGLAFPLDTKFPNYRVVTTKAPLAVEDVVQDYPHFKDEADSYESGRIRSWLGMPLMVKDEVIGMITVDREEVRPYAAEEVQLAMAFANQAAIAIENARLYQETIKERERTETLLEETFGGMIVVDPGLGITTFNLGAETITGYTAAEVLGRPLPEVLGADICKEGSLLWEAIDSGQRVAPAETAITGRSGVRYILLGITPLSDGYLLSFADITELKEVDRLKSSIVANVSHEFRAPLASIKAYTELLLGELDEGDRALRHEFLSIIDQEADRLTALINNFLDLSRLEAGVGAKRELLRLSEVVNDAISTFKVKVQEEEIVLQVDIPSDLSLVADRELMVILVENLVSNAVKFSHRGGRVEVKGWEDESEVFLSVEDEGIGIPEEELPHIFEKFRRARSTTESGIEGAGLGLVLVKEAAEAHGGTIEVGSELGVGSCFTVRLPRS